MLFGAIIVAVIAAFVGWLSTTWLPEGYAFACLIPALAGMPPPPLWGPWKTPLTPPVPDDLKPKPRPAGEMFLTLPGGDSMPANGLAPFPACHACRLMSRLLLISVLPFPCMPCMS